ncbi:Hsp20 family protein [Gluconobacter wancherniae]|uniref:Hsp20 family protein n=1 Tax=Gluconobacter wancherniae TaxID=1307955 RepID=UPI001B8B9AB6|nr:Hsp20 family protein [Gluconobacter wancherniae]MBS1088323.1 Hsp20 family protein [Gluconobacter wancherniae]
MTYDFTPLFRSAIGFDRLARMAGNAANAQAVPSYPPYNIEKTGDTDYALTMALAGFGPENVEVTLEDNTLVIRGSVPENCKNRDWLHRGIATRAFERRFALAEHIEIERADLMNGMLSISVKHLVPEVAKPRRIAIGTGTVSSGQNITSSTAEPSSQAA